MLARSAAVVTRALLASLLVLSACGSAGTGSQTTGNAACLPGSVGCKTPVGDVVGGSGDATATADSLGQNGGDGAGTGNDDVFGNVGGGDSATGVPDPKNNAPFPGYPSRELNVRIVGPSGRGHAVVSGSIAEVNGVVFGDADSITWQTANGAVGAAHGAPFFQTDPITLTPGDNLVTVTAKNAAGTASDSLTITYNPTFSFQDRLRANPRVVKVGKVTEVNATIAIGKGSNIVLNSVTLFRVDKDFNTKTTYGVMVDDGSIGSSGDEIKQDGNYTRKISLNESAPGDVFLRASVTVQSNGSKYTAYSDVLRIEAVQEIAAGDCTAAMAALADAKKAADAAGGGAVGQKAAIDSLKANGAVDTAGAASTDASGTSHGAWVRFKTGILGAVNANPDGTRGGGSEAAGAPPADNETLTSVQVQSKRALMLDPFAAKLGATEVSAAATQMAATQCPAYSVDAFKDAAANLSWFRHMYDYGIVAVAGHGDAYFSDMAADVKAQYDWHHSGSQEVVWTGHAVQCDYFAKAGTVKTCSDLQPCGPESECFLNKVGGSGVCVDHLTADVRRGRAILGSDGVYGITPGFIARHAEQKYPKSLVYLGVCRGLWNGTLAGELFAAGAAAVSGYNGFVSSEFANKWGKTFFDNLIGQKQLSGVAHVSIQDASHPGTFFSLLGARNLDAAYSDILNPSWESGNLEGWLKTGDGRVISQLGAAGPVAGKYMGIISTGLGYTATVGELKQRFCIPPGKQTFSFWWKYYSEEFLEFCGSQYQDQFLCKLEAKPPFVKTVVDVKIDTICNAQAQYSLKPADVGFDINGVYMTTWQHGTADVTPFAGNGNVLLRFFATDAGDGVYDTAVLIDKVEFD